MIRIKLFIPAFRVTGKKKFRVQPKSTWILSAIVITPSLTYIPWTLRESGYLIRAKFHWYDPTRFRLYTRELYTSRSVGEAGPRGTGVIILPIKLKTISMLTNIYIRISELTCLPQFEFLYERSIRRSRVEFTVNFAIRVYYNLSRMCARVWLYAV